MFLGPVDLSRKHKVKDVIKYVLTLYRKNKELKNQVDLEYADCPEAFELRHVDDDSDSSSDGGFEKIYFKPSMELPALELEQEMSEFDALVLCVKKSWLKKQNQPKEYFFLRQLTSNNKKYRVIHSIV